VNRHKTNYARRDLFRCANQIALILAIFVIDDDNYFSVANIASGFFD
jgi:hypothetical protein